MSSIRSETIDALGNVVKTTEHEAFDNDGVMEDVVMKYRYDIKGQLTNVFDPYLREIFTYSYDTSGKRLRTYHLDSGVKTVVIDALNLPMITQDAKGAGSLFSYDHLLRPVFIRSRDGNSQPITLRQVLRYGDSSGLTNPEDKNLNGQLYQHFDEAGKLTFSNYDFSGNLLRKKRNVIGDAALKGVFTNPPADWKVAPFTVDWNLGTSILDPQTFQTDMEYDALGRVRKMVYPKDVDNTRKVLLPEYSKSGSLISLDFDGKNCVENIGYNAKGQRILIAYGNEIMTRYRYNPQNFRLLRYRSERFVRSAAGNTIIYSPQSGTGRQDKGYSYDLEGNILATEDRVTDCGISNSPEGPDKLIRQFEYDALNRLLMATGRESDTQAASYLYNDAPVPAAPNAKHTRAYIRNYAYDKVGNVQLLNHKADNNSFLRVFDYNTGHNTVADIKNGQGNLLSDFTYDANGNTTQAGSNRNMLWDAADQLKAYYNQTGTTEPTVYAQYLYDSTGNRIKKLVRTQGGSFETMVYIDGVFEYHKKDGEGEKNQLHILDGQSRIASVRIGTAFSDDLPEKQFYVLEDHLGSSCLRLKASPGGTVIDREEYYPFGDSSLRTFTKKSYRYVGKEKDSESGLYYYGARYYAAWTCRFISVDLLAAKFADLSPYNYAGNRPITKVDIDGLQEEDRQRTPSGGGGTKLPVENGLPTVHLKPVEVSGCHEYTEGQSKAIPSVKINQYNGSVSEHWSNSFYHRGGGGAESGWYSEKHYRKMIFDAGVANGMSENNAAVWPNYDQMEHSAFFTDGRPLSEDYTQNFSGNYLAGVDAGWRQRGFNMSGTVHTSSIEFDVALNLYTLGQAAVFKGLLTKATKSVTADLGAEATSVAARGVTTADGFLFRGFTVKTPVNIPVQRFGNMSLGRPDFWGARIGTSQFANRTFGAIKPAWNPLTQYTTGVIPKGTPIKFGIIGPQGWRYPGGSFQFIVPSRSVINQSSKLIR